MQYLAVTDMFAIIYYSVWLYILSQFCKSVHHSKCATAFENLTNFANIKTATIWQQFTYGITQLWFLVSFNWNLSLIFTNKLEFLKYHVWKYIDDIYPILSCENIGYISPIYIMPSLLLTNMLSLIHIWRCRRIERCRSRWSPYH